MKTLSKFYVIFLTSFFLFSCGKDDLPKPQKLVSLRFLDAIADSPEASAGDSVTLTPYISDPTGGGRTLTIQKTACVDFGVNLGAEPTCTGNATKTDLGTTTETPGSSSQNYTGALQSHTVTLPAASIIYADPTTGTLRSSTQMYNGVSYLIFYTITSTTGDSITAFKRILVSTRPTKNKNPILPSLSTSISLPLTAKNEGSISLDTSTDTTESYSSYSKTSELVSRSESELIYWYSTSGTIKYSITTKTDSNTFSPDSSTTSSTTTFVAILKDGRGGSAISIKTE